MKWLFLSIVGMTFMVGMSNAAEVTRPEGASLWELNQDLQSLMDRVDAIEEQTAGGIPNWANKLSFKGDFRYRHEHIDAEGSDGRNRHRIRLRLFMGARVHDNVDVGFQMITGSSNPTSPNQTLDNAFSTKELNLDLAYVDFHPDICDGWTLNVIGGKMKTPFVVMAKSEMIWDADLRPEGVAVKFGGDLDQLDLFGSVGGFWINENASGAADIGMWGGQIGGTLDIGDDAGEFTVGTGYYDYVHIQGQPAVGNGLNGNLDNGVGGYAEDYNEWEVFAEYMMKIRIEDKAYPLSLFGNYVENMDADEEDTGWMLGAKFGKVKEFGDFDVRYLYKVVERDSVLGTFTDSDFGGGNTDVEGHEINVGFGLAKNCSIMLSYFLNDTMISGPSSAERDYEKFQLDFKFKF